MISLPNLVLRVALRSKPVYAFGESVLKMRRDKEAQLAQKIKKGLQASFVSVTDTTIGTSSCGQMYNIVVESPAFDGKTKIQQQRLVNELISEQLKSIHGYSLKTRSPKKVQPASEKKPEDQKAQSQGEKKQQKIESAPKSEQPKKQ